VGKPQNLSPFRPPGQLLQQEQNQQRQQTQANYDAFIARGNALPGSGPKIVAYNPMTTRTGNLSSLGLNSLGFGAFSGLGLSESDLDWRSTANSSFDNDPILRTYVVQAGDSSALIGKKLFNDERKGVATVSRNGLTNAQLRAGQVLTDYGDNFSTDELRVAGNVIAAYTAAHTPAVYQQSESSSPYIQFDDADIAQGIADQYATHGYILAFQLNSETGSWESRKIMPTPQLQQRYDISQMVLEPEYQAWLDEDRQCRINYDAICHVPQPVKDVINGTALLYAGALSAAIQPVLQAADLVELAYALETNPFRSTPYELHAFSRLGQLAKNGGSDEDIWREGLSYNLITAPGMGGYDVVTGAINNNPGQTATGAVTLVGSFAAAASLPNATIGRAPVSALGGDASIATTLESRNVWKTFNDLGVDLGGGAYGPTREMIATVLNTGSANAQKIANALRSGELDLVYANIKSTGSYLPGSSQLRLNANQNWSGKKGLFDAAATTMHEGQHWLDDVANIASSGMKRNEMYFEARAFLSEQRFANEIGRPNLGTLYQLEQKLGSRAAAWQYLKEVYGYGN
jgi:hypothetical protein